MATTANSVSADTLVTLKVTFGAECRRFKLALKELVPNQLPAKLSALLAVPATQSLLLERFSDSAASYVTLSSDDLAVYKQLLRAAKAKLKLRIRASIIDASPNASAPESTKEVAKEEEEAGKKVKINDITEDARKGPAKAPAAPAPTLDHLRDGYERQQRKRALDAQSIQAIKERRGRILNVIATHDQQAAAKEPNFQIPLGTFTVCCNVCSQDIPGAHWHCGICEDGDFDLCPDCVGQGNHCDIDCHFLIKRMIENGRVINSSVQRLPRKIRPAPSADTLVPASASAPATKAPVQDKKALPEEPKRTCNCCVTTYGADNFVTCNNCDDYDLCIRCHLKMRHGHHPAHIFSPATKTAKLTPTAVAMCKPGRNNRHLAICDGCNQGLRGVRHKCLQCPDFDFCSECFESSSETHPLHRFVPIYESLRLPHHSQTVHYGVRCDGPLCKKKTGLASIVGVRYKCAVCHDFDLCANCEALPTNSHNRTHPLIKMRTAVQKVSVVTHEEGRNGLTVVGDRQPRTDNKSTETISTVSANASTQVQNVAELKPAEKSEEIFKIESARSSPAIKLEALFERDVIPDGTKMPVSHTFLQVWTIRNPGPQAWPAGCCVRFVGGDRMLNIDSKSPASILDLDKAVMSNTIDRPVQRNETVEFTVLLKAPERQGKAISYWRVKTPDGQAFGHKLWCEIDVVGPTASQPVSPVTLTHQEAEDQSSNTFPESSKRALQLQKLDQGPKYFPHIFAQARDRALTQANAAMVAERANLIERLERAQAEVERTRRSQMIFPTLEKESPQSSVYENAPQHIQPEQTTIQPEQATTEQTTTEPATVVEKQEEDVNDEELIEDIESLDIGDDVSTDEGFLTDEEYEILDSEFDDLSQAAQ